MKAVILAGGLGTRLSEETGVKPKPMVEIGNMPILWHIMKIYASHGIDEFVICCGYKGHLIKQFFVDYAVRQCDLTVDLSSGDVTMHDTAAEPWRVTLIDTGDASMTGGRLLRVRDYVGEERFCLTYGDGLSNVDIGASIRHHTRTGAMATLTAVKPPGRFGAISLDANDELITRFAEKPAGDGAWVNGGYFVCEPDVFDLIDGDHTTWEAEPLTRIAELGKLGAYRHRGFWHPMDTLRDRTVLEDLWRSGAPPWKSW